jgi:hypothetical protein
LPGRKTLHDRHHRYRRPKYRSRLAEETKGGRIRFSHLRDSGIEETIVAKAEVVLPSDGNPTATGNAEL